MPPLRRPRRPAVTLHRVFSKSAFGAILVSVMAAVAVALAGWAVIHRVEQNQRLAKLEHRIIIIERPPTSRQLDASLRRAVSRCARVRQCREGLALAVRAGERDLVK